MNRQERLDLLSQQKFLQARLMELPESARIMRISTESRLRAIAERLASEPTDEREPARVRLTFDGAPVIRSYGIFADFGAKAVSGFTDAVVMVAASLTAPLKATGPIPNREMNQLIITNTALGSFGFELEEFSAGQLPFDEQSSVELALERTQGLLQATVGGDDELLADAAAGLDQRAIDKIRGFIGILVDNEAICAMSFRDRAFRFSDVGQVRHSLDRISRDNLVEEEVLLEGEFQGVLSKPRTFQMDLGAALGVITGKVAKPVDDLDAMNRDLSYRRVRARLQKTQVRNGRPRYVLLEKPTRLDDAQE